MDRQHHITGNGGGVKVTYIETQFVTSDAAGFKDLVQRLTGRSPTGAGAAQAPATAPHRPPRACGAGEGMRTTAAAGAGLQGYRHGQSAAGGVRPAAAVASGAPACYEDLLLGMDDFSDLFYVGASEQQRHGITGGYSDFLY